MGSPTSRAVAAALRAAHALAYVDALYKRGSLSCPIRPIRSDVDLEILDGDGAGSARTVTLWRIKAEELVLGGQRTTPREGDRIEHQAGPVREVYEAKTMTGDDCYELTDPDGQGFKVTTQLIQRY